MIKILHNFLKKGFFLVMVKKLLKRSEKKTSIQATKWAESKVKFSTFEFCQRIDKKLYEDILGDVEKIKKDSEAKLLPIKIKLGGSGNYFLLYFLVRKFYPKIIVETGVAAGWSSLSILRALHKNRVGKLFSSDFPYFRIKNPEQFIGIVAQNEPNLEHWVLDIRGDDIALPEFAKKLADFSIDLFHYDSDKSYSGRVKALQIMKNKFSENAIIIFDDIQDNLHFHDFVTDKNVNFTVLKFDEKYVGIVGV